MHLFPSALSPNSVSARTPMLTSCQMFEFLIPIGARNIRPIEREGMDPEHSGRGATSDAYGCTGRVDDALGLAMKDSTLRLYALEHPMRCCRRRLDHKLVLIKTNKPTSTLPAKGTSFCSPSRCCSSPPASRGPSRRACRKPRRQQITHCLR